MSMKKLYEPKMTLTMIVRDLLLMVGEENPGLQDRLFDLIEEMDKWGTPASLYEKKATQ